MGGFVLPFLEQQNIYDSAVWLDYSARVGNADPNMATTINIGVIWPTWDSVDIANRVFLRKAKIADYEQPAVLGSAAYRCIAEFNCLKPAGQTG